MAEGGRNLPRPAQSHPPRTSFVSNAGMLASGRSAKTFSQTANDPVLDPQGDPRAAK